MVTVKSTIAYNRDLLFQETTEKEAAGDLEMLLAAAGNCRRGSAATRKGRTESLRTTCSTK
ncbi:MAG: hypothetical protein ACRD7E_20990 [Bryobacteraceae bacterium]